MSSSLTKAQKAQVADFCSTTTASEAQAAKFLKAAKFDVEVAVNNFFESGEAPLGAPPAAAAPAAKDPKSLEALFSSLVAASGEDMEGSGSGSGSSAAAGGSSSAEKYIEGEGIMKLAADLGVDIEK